ncbi:MAG: glycosyltransferase family 39 protein [Anaerolineae bacterium]
MSAAQAWHDTPAWARAKSALSPAVPRLTVLDGILAALLTAVAAWVRLDYLQIIPSFTDEIGEIQFAKEIASGHILPVVSKDTYMGPLYHYLLAAGIWAGGDASWPRTFSLILGALTVGLTYFLGMSLGALYRSGAPARARFAGVIAAAMMAVSFVPVVVNSHIAWSNTTSPFWTTLFCLAVSETVRRNDPRLLILDAVLAGLALQTHPSVIVFVLGAALWLAVMRPMWLKTRWPWLAILVGALCIANLIGYTLVSGGQSIALASSRDYAWTGSLTAGAYLQNVRGFLLTAYELIGSTFPRALPPESAILLSPMLLSYGALGIAALVVTARRAGLPLALWLAAIVLIPIFNRRYEAYIEGRYLAPLLAPTFAAMGILLADGLATWDSTSRRWMFWATAVASAVIVVLCLVYSLIRLNQYYAYQMAEGYSNARLWQVIDAVNESKQNGSIVLIDRRLKDQRNGNGVNVYRLLDGLLDLERTDTDKRRVGKLPSAPAGAYMILTDEERDTLKDALDLELVDIGATPARAEPDAYWVYRVRARLSAAAP